MSSNRRALAVQASPSAAADVWTPNRNLLGCAMPTSTSRPARTLGNLRPEPEGFLVRRWCVAPVAMGGRTGRGPRRRRDRGAMVTAVPRSQRRRVRPRDRARPRALRPLELRRKALRRACRRSVRQRSLGLAPRADAAPSERGELPAALPPVPGPHAPPERLLRGRARAGADRRSGLAVHLASRALPEPPHDARDHDWRVPARAARPRGAAAHVPGT